MDWFNKVPKVELHLHLEGAVPLEALQELIKKYQTNEISGIYNSMVVGIGLGGNEAD